MSNIYHFHPLKLSKITHPRRFSVGSVCYALKSSPKKGITTQWELKDNCRISVSCRIDNELRFLTCSGCQIVYWSNWIRVLIRKCWEMLFSINFLKKINRKEIHWKIDFGQFQNKKKKTLKNYIQVKWVETCILFSTKTIDSLNT